MQYGTLTIATVNVTTGHKAMAVGADLPSGDEEVEMEAAMANF